MKSRDGLGRIIVAPASEGIDAVLASAAATHAATAPAQGPTTPSADQILNVFIDRLHGDQLLSQNGVFFVGRCLPHAAAGPSVAAFRQTNGGIIGRRVAARLETGTR